MFSGFNASAEEVTGQQVIERTGTILNYLSRFTEIRILVARAQNFGHQASSVNILRALIRDEWTPDQTTFTLAVYCDNPELDCQDQLQTIRTLLPQFSEVDVPFDLYGGEVRVKLLSKGVQLERGTFGICGGWDDKEQDLTVALDRLNVANYLQLQPYAWHEGTNLVVQGNTVVDLDQKFPHAQLNRRAFYVGEPVIEQQDWEVIQKGRWHEQGAIVKYLVDAAQANRIELCPVYGIRTLSPGASRLLNIVAVLLERQKVYKPSVPIVVVEIQTMTEDDWDLFVQYTDQLDLHDLPNPQPSDAFKVWHRDAEVVRRVVPHRGPEFEPDVEALKTAVEKLSEDQILVTYLDNIPQVLFNYLYAQANLPPVFEGQNTTELMLNLGRPYFKATNRVAETFFSYPTLPLGSRSLSPEATQCSEIARILFSVTPNLWNANDESHFPPRGLLPIVDAFLANKANKQNKLTRYFQQLGAFFHKSAQSGSSIYEVEGKLYWGLYLLAVQIVKSQQLGAAPAGDADLEQLYSNLVANTHGGTLNFLQAVPSGLIFDFFSRVVNDKVFQISEANPQINSDKTRVALTGSSAALGVKAGLDFSFTKHGDSIAAQLQATLADASWMLAGAPWLLASQPSVGLTISRTGTLPISGSFGAVIAAGLQMKAIVTFPSQAGIALFQGIFEDPKPSITTIVQAVGGINLQAILPQQLQLITDMEIQQFELRYDYESKSIEGIGINFSTPPKRQWSLLPAVVVDTITLYATIDSPGDVAKRSMSFLIDGQFSIDVATAYINATVPNLRVQGGLTDDSKPLSVGTVIEAYLGKQPAPLFISTAKIDQFSFLIDKTSGTYAFSMNMQTEWPIPPTSPIIFSVTNLGLTINATSNSIDSGSHTAIDVVSQDQGTAVTGAFTGTIVILPESDKITLVVSASYGGASKGWTFSGAQTTGVVSLTKLAYKYLGWHIDPKYEYGISGLSLTIWTADNSWVFTGKTAEAWSVPFIAGLSVSASVTVGYNGTKTNAIALPIVAVSSVALAPQGCKGTGYFARIETDWTWQNIDIKVWYDYCDEVNSFGITWGGLEGSVTGPDPHTKDWVATLHFNDAITLGWIIEEMVSWLTGSRFGLEAPWDLLNSINLSKLALNYTFNTSDSSRNKISFTVDIGPIDFGFARIDSIDIIYNSQAAQRVSVTLNGSFPWNIGSTAVGDAGKLGPWDASQPGQAPAPPGNGNKYFDLRLLAMGQHVTVGCFSDADTIQKAIDCMKTMKVPEPGTLPDVLFDPSSSWLIGTEFGILKFGDGGGGTALLPPGQTSAAAAAASGYLLTMQVVFNDPHLYGLRIALAGDAAKILKGLDFQIMYRQVSETVGVYQAQITLPDAMRKLDVGAYSITLPVFGIAVYTNGDFMLDIGFPWNQDFSRSFTIEGIVYPGIPVLGSAGFYFGKLSSATSTQVPRATNGTFNPVIVFGFGLQVGFGKDIQYGILSAGFSVTVVGVLEGVIAKWNPYAEANTGMGDNAQLQGAYYFWLRGAVGVIGKVYGSIDFSIIKADVNLEVKILLQLTYESYVSISLTVLASIDVTVNIKIDLGLFSVTIHLSFSMQLKETFTIDNSGTPPWSVTGPATPSILRARPETRLRAHRLKTARPLPAIGATPNWNNLAAAASPADLTAYLVTALSVARDEWQTTPSLTDQVPVYVSMLLIASVLPANLDSTSSARKAAGDALDTSFELLAKMVLRWVIAAIQTSGPLTPDAVDGTIVTDMDLALLLDTILCSTDANPIPIPPAVIDAFLTDQFRLNVQAPEDSTPPAAAAYFPVPPSLEFKIPGYQYTFGAYNSIAGSGLKALRTYFDQLAVQVSSEMKPGPAPAAVSDLSLSVASWVFADYFLLIARHMVQALRAGLRGFKYQPATGETLNDTVGWINKTGQLGGDHLYTLYDVITANQTHSFSAGKPLTIGVTHAVMAPHDNQYDTFDLIAAQYSATLTGVDVAGANALNATILQQGSVITMRGGAPYTVRSGDTLLSIAGVLQCSFSDLLATSNVLNLDGLLRPNTETAPSLVLVPLVTYQVLNSDTFLSIATLGAYSQGFDPQSLATANAGRSILLPGAKLAYPGKDTYIVQPRDCLGDVARQFQVSFSDLLAHSNVLTLAGLLAPAALLALPPFVYTTVAGDTPQLVARQFATSVQVLGDQPANGDVGDLFVATDAQGKAWYLDVPHLAQFTVGALLLEAQRTGAFQDLSGMVSRFHLHGLRLPTTGSSGSTIVSANTPGMWVKSVGGTYELPSVAGLFALTGQQFPLPTTGQDGFVITFDRSAGPAWLVFRDKTRQPIPQLQITLDSTDAARIAAITTYAQANRLAIALDALGAGPMYSSDFAAYPLTSSAIWQSTAQVALPYASTSRGIQALRLWLLPDALVDLPDPRTRATNPRFRLQVAQYDEATGATVHRPITSYGWVTTIEFTIKRIPPISGSTAAATTYEVVGAGGNDVVLLERLVAEVKRNDAFFDQTSPLILGYAPDQVSGANASPGVQTDPVSSVTMGIAQVNLSTETNPPSLATVVAEAGQTGLRLLNSPSTFMRLLWEASITRSGGFYLYYYDGADGRGLPDRIFNDKNEAVITLIALYAAPPATNDQNRLYDFMNAVATGESIDLTNAVVIAQADPPQNLTIPSSTDASLQAIAHDYFSDLGDLAMANATLHLATGTILAVTEGVFQAPPGGIALAAIAAQFGTTVTALQQANSRWSPLPDPLPFPTAIMLPQLALTVGTSPHTSSLSDITGFYSQDLTSLAAANAVVPGIFATGQQVSIPGGPRIRSASVPPGVSSVGATRPVPDDIPPHPADPNFGNLFLQHSYDLLNYQVAENAYFRASSIGLPAGPTNSTDSADSGKMRASRLVSPGDPWLYRQAVPYAQFAKTTKPVEDGLPGVGQSPYLGVGSLLQVAFTWQDYFGNSLLTVLTDPQAGDPAPYNQPPLLAGYTDPLIGLGQWPSVSSSWQVNQDNAGVPQIEVLLGFSDSRYRGVLQAVPAGATSITLTFTEPVDPSSAGTYTNYSLFDANSGESVAITQASASGATVTLTVSALSSDADYTLTVKNVQDVNQKLTFSGQAGFRYPDVESQRSSTVQINALQDWRMYAGLYQQLTDPNGIALAIDASLLKGSAGAPGSITLPPEQVQKLLTWLFLGDSVAQTTAICQFLDDRARFQTGVASPPAQLPLDNPLTMAQINDAQIFELSLSFTITRTGGAVLGDLETTAGIRQVATPVAPYQQVLESSGMGGGTLALTQFAISYQTTLSQPGAYLMKVATGVNRARVSSTQSGATLWSVRIGTTIAQPISYAITHDTQGHPSIFAPRPVSNTLQTRRHVGIRSYATGSGISPTVVYQDFSDIDMDVWCRQTFAAIDAVLSPGLTAAIQIVGNFRNVDFLQQILDGKKQLAMIAKLWMIPVFGGDTSDPSQAQEAYYQQMLATLSSAYNTRAAVELQAQVNADVVDPPASQPPQLLGRVLTTGGPSFLSATISRASPNAIRLLFSEPLQETAATQPGNYVVTNLSVQSASLSSDGLSVTLTVGGATEASVTTVTCSTAIVNRDGQPLRPPLTQTAQSSDSMVEPTAIAFTSPKLTLQSAPKQPLTFLLTAPDTVKGNGGEVVPYLNLNLTYDVTAIEHQIASLPGIEDYKASSWLSFVVTDHPSPLSAELGGFQVPMVLRAYPTIPSMANQAGGATNPPDIADLSKIRQWDYSFTYSLPYHYPQDQVICDVEFNIQDRLSARADFVDAFDQLAEFVTVFPDIERDFGTILAGIDATTTDEGDDQKKILNAAVALQSFITLVNAIVQAAGSNGLVIARRPRLRGGDPALAYHFTVEEGSVNIDTTPSALLVSLVGAPPVGMGEPLVKIDDANYECVRYTAGGYTGCDKSDHFCFVYRKRDGATGQYLSTADGQAVSERTVVLPAMDVVQRQDAAPIAHITRNARLVPDKPTAETFIYTTPDVQFANPFHPTIDTSSPVNLAALGSPQPITRSLGQHFQALFAALLAQNTQPTLTFQVELSYAYSLNPYLSMVPMQVFMQPPLTVDVQPGKTGTGTLSQMIDDWVAATELWFSTRNPTCGGTLWLDLVTMSNLTQHPMPLLRLRTLYLSLQNVDPSPLCMQVVR